MIPFDNKHNNNNGLSLIPFLTLYVVICSYLTKTQQEWKKQKWK